MFKLEFTMDTAAFEHFPEIEISDVLNAVGNRVRDFGGGEWSH